MTNSSNQSLTFDAAATVNIVLSLPTNSYIVWLIVAGPRDTVVRELLPLNLAAFEILFCLISAGGLLKHFTIVVTYLRRVANCFLKSGRPILQCCICVEQFLAVVHPVLFLKYKTLSHKAAFSVATWAVIIGLTLFYIFSPFRWHKAFLSECVVITLIMLFCYFSVLAALKRPRPGNGKTERDVKMKKRAAFTIVLVIVSFVGTYLLWCVAIGSNINTWFSSERKLFIVICTHITFVTGFVQPLIYLQRRGKCPCTKPRD